MEKRDGREGHKEKEEQKNQQVGRACPCTGWCKGVRLHPLINDIQLSSDPHISF